MLSVSINDSAFRKDQGNDPPRITHTMTIENARAESPSVNKHLVIN